MKTGTVFLVGAGPGDPALLTEQGKACLEQADVVVYDALFVGAEPDTTGLRTDLRGKDGGKSPQKAE